MKPKMPAKAKRSPEQPWRVTFFTAIGTWITCSHWSSRTSCTPWWRRRWMRCSNTTCLGSKYSFWRRPWTFCASVGGLWCTPTSLLIICGKTTNVKSLRYIIQHTKKVFKTKKKNLILQDNQRDLEQATETLSEYLERDICAANLVDIKQKVQDKYR